jgi:hypothetical protein
MKTLDVAFAEEAKLSPLQRIKIFNTVKRVFQRFSFKSLGGHNVINLNLVMGLFKEIRFRINIAKTKCEIENEDAVETMK